jgi:hypothetical protein
MYTMSAPLSFSSVSFSGVPSVVGSITSCSDFSGSDGTVLHEVVALGVDVGVLGVPVGVDD